MKVLESKKMLDNVLENIVPNAFSADDPLGLLQAYSKQQDLEIAGFFAATLAWGNRKSIIASATKLLEMMDNAPYDFIIGHSEAELKPFEKFVHRTYNGTDCLYFIHALRGLYLKESSLENYFHQETIYEGICNFRKHFFDSESVPLHSQKHVANPAKGSATKRLNMYLRWMVRREAPDLGIWKNISPAKLHCPLDVHVIRAAKHFGLLERKQSDWKAVEELTQNLQKMDSEDPIKYDLALFVYSMKFL